MKTLLIMFMILLIFVGMAYAFETYGNEKVFVKNGVTYIIGNPTPSQQESSDQAVKERFERNERNIQKEQDRVERIEIERIRATRNP